MIVPPRPKDSLSLSIGAILRMMFASGATDDVVTRFVALHANAMLSNPLPPVIEMGPALQQAATSAGVEVARELLGQIQQVRQASGSLMRSVPNGAVEHVKAAKTGRVAKPKAAQAGKSASGREIYRFDVATGRTSVSLPADLLAAAKAAFGDEDLTKLVQSLYGQAVSTRQSAAKKAANSGPVRKVNKSSLVRDALALELLTRQTSAAGVTVAGAGTFH